MEPTRRHQARPKNQLMAVRLIVTDADGRVFATRGTQLQTSPSEALWCHLLSSAVISQRATARDPGAAGRGERHSSRARLASMPPPEMWQTAHTVYPGCAMRMQDEKVTARAASLEWLLVTKGGGDS